jgi:MFS family permease
VAKKLNVASNQAKAFPPEKRGAAMGSVGLVIMFAPAIGPTLSGIIIEALHWRWLFFLVLPFAHFFSVIFAFIYLKNVTEITKPKVDILSVTLSTLGFGGLDLDLAAQEKLPQVGQAPKLLFQRQLGCCR